jgi:hypothetical protein
MQRDVIVTSVVQATMLKLCVVWECGREWEKRRVRFGLSEEENVMNDGKKLRRNGGLVELIYTQVPTACNVHAMMSHECAAITYDCQSSHFLTPPNEAYRPLPLQDTTPDH